jgi:hypothetical protein
MPPKISIAYGKNFHFYLEAHEQNYVYLELEDVPYEVGYLRVMLAIPVDIWETIRGLGTPSLDLVNASDADLIEKVTSCVEERVAEYERARSSGREAAEMVRLRDSLIFGAADEPREDQVARGVHSYKMERERQRAIVARMTQHKIIEIDAEPG